MNRPDEAPGVSPHSGQPGESFNAFRKRLVGGVQQQSAEMRPKDAALNITSGRALQTIDAWARNGQPADGSVDANEILAEHGEFSKPGQLFRLNAHGLQPVSEVSLTFALRVDFPAACGKILNAVNADSREKGWVKTLPLF